MPDSIMEIYIYIFLASLATALLFFALERMRVAIWAIIVMTLMSWAIVITFYVRY